MAKAIGMRPGAIAEAGREALVRRARLWPLAVGACAGFLLGGGLFATLPAAFRAEALIAPDMSLSPDVQMRQAVTLPVLVRAAQTPELAAEPTLQPPPPGVLAQLWTTLGLGQEAGESRASRAGQLLAGMVGARRVGPDAIEIVATAPRADLAAAIANAVAVAGIGLASESRSASDRAAATRDALQLQTMQSRLLEAETRLAAARQPPDEASGPAAELANARKALAEARQRLEEAQGLAAGKAPAPGQPLKSGGLERLRLQLSEALRAEGLASKTLGPRHPLMIDAQQQVKIARKALADEARRTLESARADVAFAETAEANAAGLLAKLADPQATGSIDPRSIEAEVASLRLAYEAALRGPEGRSAAAAQAPAAIIALATPSTRPVGPLPSVLMGGGTMLGLLAGAAIVAFREHRRPARPSPPAAAAKVAAKVAAKAAAKAAANPAAKDPPASAAAPKDPPPDPVLQPKVESTPAEPPASPRPARAPGEALTVLVTSVSPRTRRTQTAIALAMEGVRDGLSVLLVDAQPRRRMLTRAMAPTALPRAQAQVLLGGQWRPLLPLNGDGPGRLVLIPQGLTLESRAPRLGGLTGFDLIVIDGPEMGPAAAALAVDADKVVLAGPRGGIAPDPGGTVARACFEKVGTGFSKKSMRSQ